VRRSVEEATLKALQGRGQRAAQAMLDHYATLAGGVLIGMSAAMAGTAPAAKPSRAAR
jgi:hypothetical protein